MIGGLLIAFGVGCLWAALHITLGSGIFLSPTFIEIREGNFDAEDAAIVYQSTATS